MSLDEKMVDLARLAAETDHAEGGHRVGANVATLIHWAATVRAEHGACGPLALERDGAGGPTAATCPAHGRLEAPEWKPPPS